MESKTGSLLAKIAGIINIVIAGVILLIGIASLFVGAINTTAGSTIKPFWVGIFIMIVAIIVLVFGLLFLKASRMMKIRERTRGGAVLSLVIGILSATSIAGILGIIGGAIGLSDSKK